jgi:ribosomal protein S6/ribosomal protein S18
MRLYEAVYIFDAALDEAAINEKLEKFHALAIRNGGEVVAVDHWTNRQLAYPVAKQKTGYYVVSHFRADVTALPEFERIIKLDEAVMRYLLVLNEGEPTTGMSVLVERPPRPESPSREDDDDEDEDEEEDDRDSPPEFSGGRGRRRQVEGPAIDILNFKDVSTLSRFLTESGKLLPKRTTKVNARFQRQLGRAVKRARYLALIPYVRNHEV